MKKIINIFVIAAGISFSANAADRLAAIVGTTESNNLANFTFKKAALDGDVETVRTLIAAGNITGRSCFEAIEWNIGIVQANRERLFSGVEKVQYQARRTEIAKIIVQYMEENPAIKAAFLVERAAEEEDPTGALM